MKRRTFLTTAVSATSIAAFAGCLGEGDEASSGNDDGGIKEGTPNGQEAENESEGTVEVTGEPDLVVNETEIQSESEYGSMDYTGVVRMTNEGGATAYEPSVTIKFYDEEDKMIDSGEENALLVRQGQSWEVRRELLEDGTPERIDVNVESGDAGAIEKYENPPEIEVSNEGMEKGDNPIITADITNTSDADISVTVMGQFLREDDTLVGGSLDFVDNLSPDDTWTTNAEWHVTNDQLMEQVAKYSVFYGVD